VSQAQCEGKGSETTSLKGRLQAERQIQEQEVHVQLIPKAGKLTKTRASLKCPTKYALDYEIFDGRAILWRKTRKFLSNHWAPYVTTPSARQARFDIFQNVRSDIQKMSL
jgi:hypothetical protein